MDGGTRCGGAAVSDAADFLERLVQRFPQLGEDLEVHVENNGGALPHVFFGLDVTPAVVEAYRCDTEGREAGEYAELDWRGLLGFFEEVYPAAPLPVKEVIVTSFLMDLPWPHEPGYGLVGCLGPVLAWKFVQVRPGG
jgi:hypothetical protein